MKTILFLIVFLMSSTVFSQGKYISITKLKTGKEYIIKENLRVRIKTTDGRKLIGRLQIEDDNSIFIRDVKIPLSSIAKIKRNPLALTIAVDGALIVGSAFTALVGLFLVDFVGPTSLAFTVPVFYGLAVSGLNSPNFIPAFKVKNNLDIKIVDSERLAPEIIILKE